MRFSVTLKRPCEESAEVEIEADDEEEAERLALAQADKADGGGIVWEVVEWSEAEATDVKSLGE
jgi:hypothetical protein